MNNSGKRLRPDKKEPEGDLLDQLFKAKTAEEVQAVLKTLGVHMSVEEIQKRRAGLVIATGQNSDKALSDEDLDGISGGVHDVWRVLITAFGLDNNSELREAIKRKHF